MSVDVQHGRLYCTVADHPFGPQCATDDEAWELFEHVVRTRAVDPREPGNEALGAALSELRAGVELPTHPTLLCLCGSGQRWGMKFGSRTSCGVCHDSKNWRH